MRPFSYIRASDVPSAVAAAQDRVKFIAGGTNLFDLMKQNVEAPRTLVDVTRLPLSGIHAVEHGGLRIGALTTNTALAYDETVVRRYPLLARAVLAGASPQLRNMATVGGNLMQRTRCPYFFDIATACNKRAPGQGCAARDGFNRMHAILGHSEHCIAVHPSDMCVALAALEAVVSVVGVHGERDIPIADFHRLPENTPQLDTNLQVDELIIAVELPERGFADHCTYLKVRDRESFAFALVSVAAGLELDGDVIRDARICLGGVAHKPWRDPAVEEDLRGRRATRDVFDRAAGEILRTAEAFEHNRFKIDLARRAIVRALTRATVGGVEP